MPREWHIREVSPEDFDAVLEVVRDAFGGDVEANLVAELTAGDGFLPELSLLAQAGERTVGHVLLTRARAGHAEALLLAPLAVLPAWQREGAGSALVREGLRRAAALGFGIALVLGSPGYYTRFGFEPAEPHGVLPPYPVRPSEAWMVVELISGELPKAGGIVRLADAFMHEELWRE